MPRTRPVTARLLVAIFACWFLTAFGCKTDSSQRNLQNTQDIEKTKKNPVSAENKQAAKARKSESPVTDQGAPKLFEQWSADELAVAAYRSKTGLVFIDKRGRALKTLESGKREDGRVAYNRVRDELYLERHGTIYSLDVSSQTLTKAFDIKGWVEETQVRNQEHFRVVEGGDGLCVTYSDGDPTEPEIEGDEPAYVTWSFYIDLVRKTVTKAPCPESIESVPSKGIAQRPPLTMSRSVQKCGVQIGGRFFEMPLLFERNGKDCVLTLHPKSPSGRYQLVSAYRGADDAMQTHHVVYIADLTQQSFLPLARVIREEWLAKPPSSDFAVEIAVDGYEGLWGVPWRWAAGTDLLHLKGHILDLAGDIPSASKVASNAVFILPGPKK